MIELHERFTESLFEAGWQPSIQPELLRGESKQSRRAEEKSEGDRINQIRIEFFNMPVFAVEMPESKFGENLNLKT